MDLPLTLSSLFYLLSPLLQKFPLSLLPISQPPPIHPDVATPTSIGSQFSISSLEASQPEKTQELPPFTSFPSDVRPPLSQPIHLKLQPDQSTLGRQHRGEYYTNHARRTKWPRFNRHLQYCLQPEFCKWKINFWVSTRQERTTQNTSLSFQRLVVPPQAITALPHWFRLTLLHQFSFLTFNLPLTHKFRWVILIQWVFLWPN